ncbi:GTP cyclohydrolase II [Qingshengfaniella alkalisoli]|uniref:GTP cyclohydrolase-2 n=1 Tax=Qingshengfaniella alkalisoli TaxID=2599296 RepID=A0A5B8I731_9RHOB|nr:GTP cyclohydrolase II [Qingshengfaniella alkalisoli]QDY68346.1 GTP cyclohydrolase II [Qingshengfaniella alkalisoli]
MGLGPDIVELIARSRGDLRMGLGIVLRSGDQQGLAFAAETLDADRLANARRLGPAVIALTARRAETLKARSYDGDVARVRLPQTANLEWIRALADPADDLRHPMKGPLETERDGSADIHRAALILCKAARLLPAAVVIAPVMDLGAGLTSLDVAEVIAHSGETSPMSELVSARLPLEVSEQGRLHIFRPDDGAEEHYAVEIGSPDRGKPVLSRLHSACFTGDLLGSLKCDCGPQLRAAMRQMGEEGAGVLLYLNQEGRGIGLANKMRAYSLQDQGFDTVEANHRLGFEDDERDFRIGAALLRELGFGSVRLMTNNPAKVAMMEKCGISVVERVPLKVGGGDHNAAYLATKAAKSGHLL